MVHAMFHDDRFYPAIHSFYSTGRFVHSNEAAFEEKMQPNLWSHFEQKVKSETAELFQIDCIERFTHPQLSFTGAHG